MSNEASKFQDKFLDFQKRYLGEIETSVKYVYHYTSLNGLTGILNESSIWLSDNSLLTQIHEEIIPAKEKILYILSQINFPDKSQNDILGEIKNYFMTNKLNCYISCFCKKSNLDNMWKKYADNGTGACIEFDISKNDCRKFFTENAPHYFRLYNVIYNEDKFEKQVEYLINYFFYELYHEATDKIKFRDYIYGFLLYVVYLYKKNSFGIEEEVRLFVDNHNAKAFDIQCRYSDEGMPVNYISSCMCNEACGNPTLPPIKRIFVRSEINIDKVWFIVNKFDQNISVESVENVAC